MERRPELLSSVMLRQNPHNVHEWHKRVKLFAGQPHKQILTFTEAVTTVDIDKVPAAMLWAAMRVYQLYALESHTTRHARAGGGQGAHAVDSVRALLRAPRRP